MLVTTFRLTRHGTRANMMHRKKLVQSSSPAGASVSCTCLWGALA
jgi:hypothetical protein